MVLKVGDVVRLKGAANHGRIGRICVVTAMAYTVRLWLNPDNHAEGSKPVAVSLSEVEAATGDAPQC